MTEFYEYESSGARCLRSSPIAALISLIIILIGAAAFGLGVFYAKRYITTLLDARHLFPYLEYTAYVIICVSGVFSVLAYLICVISSGWNAKRCFEGSKKASCGRCLNNVLLAFLLCAVLFWVLVSALLSYPVISMSLLLYRDAGPVRAIRAYSREYLLRPARLVHPDGGEEYTMANSLTNSINHLPDVAYSDTKTIMDRRLIGQSVLDVIKNPREIIAEYFNCSELTIDLSYYGLYDEVGYPILISSMNINLRIRDALICACSAFLGALFLMFGYLVLTTCVAINYAKLQELRYYDPSLSGDETIRLRH